MYHTIFALKILNFHPLTNKLQDSESIECSHTWALSNPSWGTAFFFLLRSAGNPLKKAQRRRKQRREKRRRSSKSHRLPRKRNLRSGEELLSRMFSTMMRLVHVYNDQTNDLQNITWFTLFHRNQERIMIPSGHYSKLYRPCRFLLQWANTKKWARGLGR